ncbi:MAG: signal peptidase I [Pyrinomonadaceae bacterium]|nr:signal peptidase I [Pyrinomonadaceae bacterium]
MTFIVLTCAFSQIGCAIQPMNVAGVAMMPTISNEDLILVNRYFGELKRGDIIVFKLPKDTSQIFIERIIALPKDKIEIRNGQVFINDALLSEDYVKPEFNNLKANMKTAQIPEGNYFVMGDNRDNSFDSRAWGLLPKDLVTGKYVMTYLSSK